MTGLGAMRATPEGIAADIGCSADNVREAFGKDLLKDYPKPDSSEQLAVNPIKTPSQDVEMVGVHGGGGGEKSGGFATPAEGGAA